MISHNKDFSAFPQDTISGARIKPVSHSLNLFQKTSVISEFAFYQRNLEQQSYRAALTLRGSPKFLVLHSNLKDVFIAQIGMRCFQPTQLHLSRDHVSQSLHSPGSLFSISLGTTVTGQGVRGTNQKRKFRLDIRKKF